MRVAHTYRCARRNAGRTGTAGGIGPAKLRRKSELPRAHQSPGGPGPTNGPREIARRTRQVAAGSLRAENGLVA